MQQDEIGALMKKIALEFDKIALPILSPYGFTPSQFKILRYLIDNPGKDINQKNIENFFSITNPTVTGILNNLEKAGWVKRVTNPKDIRSKFIVLDKRALDNMDLLNNIQERIVKSFDFGLSKSEMNELGLILTKVHNNMKKKREASEINNN